MASTRPSILSIDSGTESWDTEVDDNFDKIVGKPFPGLYSSDAVTLAAQYPPSQYAACKALVWDGIDGSTLTQYVSNGVSWVAVATTPDSLGQLTLSETYPYTTTDPGKSTTVYDSWTTILFNETSENSVSGASYASGTGEIDLPSGDYRLSGFSHCCLRPQWGRLALRLYNVDTASEVISSQFGSYVYFSEPAITHQVPVKNERFTIASAYTFKLQYYFRSYNTSSWRGMTNNSSQAVPDVDNLVSSLTLEKVG